jgi:hypothetical protein
LFSHCLSNGTINNKTRRINYEIDRYISHRHFATDSLLPSIVHNTNDLFVPINIHVCRHVELGYRRHLSSASLDSIILIWIYNDLVICVLLCIQLHEKAASKYSCSGSNTIGSPQADTFYKSEIICKKTMKERCDCVFCLLSSRLKYKLWLVFVCVKWVGEKDTKWQMSHLTVNIRKNDDKYVRIFVNNDQWIIRIMVLLYMIVNVCKLSHHICTQLD